MNQRQPNQPLQIAIIDGAKPPKPLPNKRYEWGEAVGNVKVFPCHSAQLDILRSKAKFTFAFAGTGGGKTCLIPLWIYKQLSRIIKAGKRNPRVLVVSPSLPIFESSQLKQHILSTFDGTPLAGEWLDGKKIYRLPNGGEIVVKTVGDGSDYQKLTGGQYDAVVADEVYFLTQEVWDEIRRRGGKGDCPTLCVTTPNANNWIFDVKQQAERGNADYYVKQWGSIDNPTYSREHLERERLVMSDAAFRRMYGGQFAALEGLVYDCFADPSSPRYPVIAGNPDKLPSPPVRFFGGNDWGYKPDPSAVLVAAECEDGNIYIVEELYGTEITPDELATKVRALVDRWAVRVDSKYADVIDGGRFACFYTDVSRPEETTMFRRAGIPIRNKRVTDILAGVKITDAWLRAGRLKVYSSCPNLIRELRGYQWDANRQGGLKDKPKGGSDHAADALRYMISSHKYGLPVTPAEPAEPLSEAKELEKLINYGLLDADPSEQLKELEDKTRNQRFIEMAFGNDSDDDPMGIWQN